MSPTTKTSGCPGRVRSGRTCTRPARSSPAPDCSASWAPQAAARDARGPDLAGGLDGMPSGRVLVGDAVLVHLDDRRPEGDVDADLRQPAGRLLAQVPPERGQDLRRGVEQHDPRARRVDAAEVVSQGAVRELGDLPGHLDPGRARADDDEGEQPVDLVGVAGDRGNLGQLERAEDPPAQLQRVVDVLHPGGEPGELVVAEVGLPGAGGHDEAVVADRDVPGHPARVDRAAGQVDVGDVAEQHGGVLLVLEDLAGRRGDLTRGQDAGGDLVEQRLEQVGRRPRDEGHLDVGLLQRLGGEQATEARPDDDDSMPPRWTARRGGRDLGTGRGRHSSTIPALPASTVRPHRPFA